MEEVTNQCGKNSMPYQQLQSLYQQEKNQNSFWF